jgi:ABC-type transporter Mla MlaB component
LAVPVLSSGAQVLKENTQLLRITIQNFHQSATIKLEGQLKGPWVEETERTWRNSSRRVAIVDLCGVTSVDARGKSLLAKMYEGGANLVADAPMMKYIIEQVTLEVSMRKETVDAE